MGVYYLCHSYQSFRRRGRKNRGTGQLKKLATVALLSYFCLFNACYGLGNFTEGLPIDVFGEGNGRDL